MYSTIYDGEDESNSDSSNSDLLVDEDIDVDMVAWRGRIHM